jgi:DNA-binding CsgD family transcriptional regulator
VDAYVYALLNQHSDEPDLLAKVGRLLHGFANSVTMPLAFLDRNCAVLFGNSAFGHFIAQADGVAVTDGQFGLARTSDHAQFKDLVGKACDVAEDRRSRAISVLRPSGELPYLFHIGQLTWIDQPAASLSVVNQGSYRAEDAERMLMEAYALTPAEARVAVGIGQAYSPADVAGQLAIAIGTVRFQMHQVFRKTGVSRQADLVRLVLPLLSMCGH